MTATEKPRYLGILNAIANAEARGGEYLSAWADRTTDSELEQALRTVAARETEHSATFARRIVELGYRVRPREDDEDETRRKAVVVDESLDDGQKFAALGYDEHKDPDAPDVFEGYFRDHSIDPVTGSLLGRFICEERDSGRVLRAAYRSLRDRTAARSA